MYRNEKKSIFSGPNFGMIRTGQTKRTGALRGMERLLQQGGFIQEVIEEQLEELFPKEIWDIIYKYNSGEQGFWTVVEATDRAISEMQDFEFSREGERIGVWPDKFRKWYVEQTVRVANEQAKNEQEHFWNTWDLSREARRTLQKMPVLEERILFLRNGLDGEEPRDVFAVAQLPEFGGNTEYVEKLFVRLERFMKREGQLEEEFGQACNQYKPVREKE